MLRRDCSGLSRFEPAGCGAKGGVASVSRTPAPQELVITSHPLRSIVALCSVLATVVVLAIVPSAQAFNSAYCGGTSGTYLGGGGRCTSGAHTWHWHYVSWQSAGCQTVQEFDYNDSTGTGLSNRLSQCPTKFIESYNDLDPYTFLQRAQAINLGSAGVLYGYAQTCGRGQSC